MRTLVTFGLGALAMYLLDPQQGRRRRALLQDRLTHARTVLRKLSNRAHGVAAEARHAIKSEPGRASEPPEGAQHLGR
jgi:hypothetical protein